MLKELGISAGTAVVILIVLYFIIKWAVKNGIEDFYEHREDIQEMKKEIEDLKAEIKKKNKAISKK